MLHMLMKLWKEMVCKVSAAASVCVCVCLLPTPGICVCMSGCA